jgi:hypothetical protein
MIPENEYPEIVKGLLERSRHGKVNWIESSDDFVESFFKLDLPKSSIQLLFSQPQTEPDFYRLNFMNENGKVVGSWIVSEGDKGWELMEELYNEVSKQVTGWDKVLEDVKRFVGKQ